MLINNRQKRNAWLCRTAILVGIVLTAMPWTGDSSGAQSQMKAKIVKGQTLELESIDTAISNICEERSLDRQGTIPIDEMAMQHALPFSDPRVIAGKERAQRLLPVARRLVPATLARLAFAYQSPAINRDRITARLSLVDTIKLDIEQRDNAIVRPSEPHAIIFGTIFLAGLRSDEAMIAVLSHELTHVADGPDHLLNGLFDRVALRASQLSGWQIEEEPAMELTCELVGVHVMQTYSSGGSSGESKSRRLARAFGKDCVRHDLADEAHLSPRQTLRMLLLLEPSLTRTFAETEVGQAEVGRRLFDNRR